MRSLSKIFLPLIVFALAANVLLAQSLPQKAPKQRDGQLRRLTQDDLFRLEGLSDSVVSPDGKWLAYVRQRPKDRAKNHLQPYLGGNDRADIWLVSTTGGQSVNLTGGGADGAGFWNIVWSPNSERIAMFSTRGGSVRLWVIERASKRLKQLTERGVNTLSSPVWLSATELACVILPKGEKPLFMTVETRTADVAARKWARARAGRETTANELESGVPDNYAKRPKSALIIADAVKGTSRVVAEGNFVDLSVSPDRSHIAAVEEVGPVKLNAEQRFTHTQYMEKRLAVFSADGKRLGVGNIPVNLTFRPLRWSPDGMKLALTGRDTAQKLGVYLYRVGSEKPEFVTGDDLVLPTNWSSAIPLVWSGGNELIARVEGKPKHTNTARRSDWWVLGKAGQARNLTAAMKTPPAQLIAAENGNEMLGVTDGRLWRIPIDGSSPVEIASDKSIRITSLIQLTTARQQNNPNHMIIGSRIGSVTNLFRVDLKTGKAKPLAKPEATANLAFYDADRELAVFRADTRNGSYLWFVRGSEPARTIVETNSFLKEIGEGEAKKIEYRSLDGRDLTAWLLLPPDYQLGRRYPTLTWVYTGTIYGNDRPISTKLNWNHPLNLQLLASRGYVVLLPSMPLKPEPDGKDSPPSDPYLELTNGVLPAVDKAIELGYADPEQLGVMGQSYGGYSTYGLVTQTNRFRAAVSLAGLSNLLSIYGTFDARYRYENFSQENLFAQGFLEVAQGRMGRPPWKDAERYVRNSPIFYADRVRTPLMIIQGDMDYIPIQQGEEFFTALYRQGKRASFIRYWGEGHVLDSPANIRDMWYRIYTWFDEFLDISRDRQGNLVWEGQKVKSRNGAPSLKP